METTTLRIGGEVATPRQFSFDDLAALPHQIPDIGVLAPGRQGCAVPLRTLLDETGVSERATHITLYADDGNYSASVPLAEVIDHAVIIYGLDHQPLPAEQGGQTPAIALTGYASRKDRERALAAGYHQHIAKPIEQTEMIAAIAALVGRGD